MGFLKKLENIVDTDSFDFTVRNPADNVPLMILVLAGPAHPNAQAWKRRSERGITASVKRARDLNSGLTNFAVEGLEDDEVGLVRVMDRLMSCTLGWKALPNDPDPAPPYDAKEMRENYQGKEWLRNLVMVELGRAENLTKSLASSS